MKIRCLDCAGFEFELELDSQSLDRQPVISLTCPKCGSSTALQKRDGGGVEISLDKHLASKRAGG